MTRLPTLILCASSLLLAVPNTTHAAAPNPNPSKPGARKRPPAKKGPAKTKPKPLHRRYFVKLDKPGASKGASAIRYAFQAGDTYAVTITNAGQKMALGGGKFPKLSATFKITHTKVTPEGTVVYQGVLKKANAKRRGKRRDANISKKIEAGQQQLKRLVGTTFKGLVTAEGRHVISWQPPAADKKGRGVMWTWMLLDILKESTVGFPRQALGKGAQWMVQIPLPYKEACAQNTYTLKGAKKNKVKLEAKLGGGTVYDFKRKLSAPMKMKLVGSGKATVNLRAIAPTTKFKQDRIVPGFNKSESNQSSVKVGKIKKAK